MPAPRRRHPTVNCGVLVAAMLACLGSRSFAALRASGPRATPGAAAGGAAAAPETVTIEMERPLDGRIGVAIVGGRRTVSRLSHEEAYQLGWRVGDVITEVNGEVVADNEAVKAAVKKALADNKDTGRPLHFTVKRRTRPPDTSRGMLRMTPGTGGDLTVPMLELTRSLLGEFPVVVFLDGTLKAPNSNLSARAGEILSSTGLAFKAVDASDDKFNPGVRMAVEELSGEHALPQLFVGGVAVANGFKLQELHDAGRLVTQLRMAGAVDASGA